MLWFTKDMFTYREVVRCWDRARVALALMGSIGIQGCGDLAALDDLISGGAYSAVSTLAQSAVSQRLVAEGLDQASADSIAEAGVNAANEAESGGSGTSGLVLRASRLSAAVEGGSEDSDSFTVADYLGEFAVGAVEGTVKVKASLPAGVSEEDVLAAVVEALTGIVGNEAIEALLGEDVDLEDIAASVFAYALYTAQEKGLVESDSFDELVSAVSIASITGIGAAGISDPDKVQTVLGSLSAAGGAVVVQAFGGAGQGAIREAVIGALGEGLMMGFQFQTAWGTMDLEATFSIVSGGAMMGMVAGGMEGSDVAAMASHVVGGMTRGAVGAADRLPPGRAPAFGASAIGSVLGSCGAFMSTAFAFLEVAGVEVSTSDFSSSAIASSISGGVTGSGVTLGGAPSCTVTSGGSSGVVSGGSSCPLASAPFASNTNGFSPIMIGGSSLFASAQTLIVPSGSPAAIGGLQVYGKVISGSPSLVVSVIAGDVATTGVTIDSSMVRGSSSSLSNSADAWIDIPFAAPFSISQGASISVVIQAQGGEFTLYRDMGGSISGGHALGKSSNDGGPFSPEGDAMRGDDLMIKLFGCQ